MHQRCARLHGLEWVGERLEHLVLDPHLAGGLPRVELRVGDDHGEEVGHAARDLAFRHEHRLVGIVEARASESGNVRRCEHADDAGHGCCLAHVNLDHPGAWMLRQHHRAVQHAGDAHVIHERLVAESLRGAALSRDRVADAMPPAVAVRP